MRGLPVPNLRKRPRKCQMFGRWRMVPYGVRKGDPNTTKKLRVYDDMAVDPKSPRARELRRATRDIGEHMEVAGIEQMEPHGPDCCICHDHGPECPKCWPNTAEIITARMIEAGLPQVFVRCAVGRAGDRGVLDLLMAWMGDRDPVEREAIEVQLHHLIEAA